MLHLRLFGALRWHGDDGLEHRIAGKPAELLAYLAVRELQGRSTTRSHAAGALFPDSDETAARKLLANILYRLRQELGPAAPHVHATESVIGLRDTTLDAAQLQAALECNDTTALTALLPAARDELLEAFDQDWAQAPRVKAREAALEYVRAQLQMALRAADKAGMLVWARHALELDPSDEAACVIAMRQLAESGQHVQALALYEATARAMKHALDLEPGPELAAMAAAVRRERGAAELAETRVFVGRKSERARLLRWLGQPGQPLFLIEGDPGIGKSALMEEVLAAARWRGWRTGHAKAPQAAAPSLLAPLSAALSGALHSADRSRLAGTLGETTASQLMAVLDGTPADGSAMPERRTLLLEVVLTQVLEEMSRHTRLLLALDDAHWADETVFAVLPALAEACARANVRMLLSARPAELRKHASGWRVLEQLEAEGRMALLQLGGLNATDLAELATALQQPLAHADADTLLHASHGNPLLARAWLAGGKNDDALAAHVFDSRIRQLAPDGQRALAVLALADRALEYDAWRTAADADPPVEALLLHNLIAHGPAGYALVHDLMRPALAHVLDDAGRVAAHARIARVLAIRADPATLGWHHAQAGEWPLAAARYCESVEAALRVGAHARAREELARAAQAADRAGAHEPAHLRVRLLRLRLAQTKVWSGDQEAEANALAADCERNMDLSTLAGVSLVQIRYLGVQTRFAEMDAAGERAMRLAQSLGDESAAILIGAELARFRVQFQILHEQEQAGLEALVKRAEHHGAPEPLVACLLAKAALHHKIAELGVAEAQLKRVEALRDANPGMRYDAQMYLSLKAVIVAALYTDHETAFDMHQQRIRHARQTGDLQLLRSAAQSLTIHGAVMGQLETVTALCEELLRESERHAPPDDPFVHMARARLCDSWMERNDIARAGAVLAPTLQWLDAAPRAGLPGFICWVSRSMLLKDQGRYDEALEANSRMLAFELGKGTLVSVPLLMRARIFQQAGRNTEAAECIARARPLIDPNRASDELNYMHWVDHLVTGNPLSLARCRHGLFEIALRMRTPRYRRDAITRRATARDMQIAWNALNGPKRDGVMVRGDGGAQVPVTWTLDDGLLDREISAADGATVLRRHRLKRLTLEANMAGAFASHEQLAHALGVTVRTIERDAAALAGQGLVLHTLKFAAA